MRLAAIYNVFDGEELLEGSIRQIRDLVDFIFIVYQTTSNNGEDHPKLYITLRKLEQSKLVDVFHFYQAPHWEKNMGDRETGKRNEGIKEALSYGATHYILMDCDEYYRPAEFKESKRMVEEFNLPATFCSMETYFKKPTWRIAPPESYYVPFIQALDPTKDRWVGHVSKIITADRTRTPIGLKENYIFKPENLRMHHYSWVRRDIGLKLRNSSANDNLAFRRNRQQMEYEFKNFENLPNQRMPHFIRHEIREVENEFNIPQPFEKI